MAFEDTMRSLREFELGDLDLDNVGAWPVLVKVLIWLMLLIAVLVGGYYYHIEDLQLQLAQTEEKEVTLKKDFEKNSSASSRMIRATSP